MSNLGLGVMINKLFGNNGAELVTAAEGKSIASCELADDQLRIRFTDGTGIKLFDAGQSCCESRYMTCDDDLPYHVGATFIGVEVRDAPDAPADYDCHEVQFLVVRTSKGDITAETHNEHNGNYGGVSLNVQEIS